MVDCAWWVLLTLFLSGSRAQFGGPALSPTVNPNTGSIPVVHLQTDGYASTESWAYFNGSVKADLGSFTVCHRFQLWFQRPRMYLFTYAFSDEDANELNSEYHLGRKAIRICKRGTKYCGWHREMPDYYQWRHICLTYDGNKDLFKVFVDGEKTESGSWANDNPVQPVRKEGVIYLGQDQDSYGGGFNSRQSWSGLITQFNLWDWALEDYFIENAAECRSDLLGNIQDWQADKWIVGKGNMKMEPLFKLCGAADDIKNKYFLFPNQFSYFFYMAWCRNQGGGIVVPMSDESYHEIMDVAEGIVNRDAHEKCMHASGSLIIWGGMTDEWEEDNWV